MAETNLTVKEEINNNLLTVFGNEDFPVALQSGINDIMTLVKNNKTVPELYEKELKETMVSTSMFQDICVQMEEHFTPHRKVRQVMLELSGKLDALDAAKNNHKKTIVKVQALEKEVDELQDIYTALSFNTISFDLALRLSSISYTVKSGETSLQYDIISPSIIELTRKEPIENEKYIATIRDKVKVALGNKIVDYEEAKRGLKSTVHMIKDSAVKAYQLRNQVEIYSKEVEESGISFDESEFIYYVMFFTAEAERQLRTGDHQVDRGTYKAISQLPDFIRLKVLKNIDYIKKKLIENNYDISMDYIFKTDRNILEPFMERNENNILIVEGVKVNDYLLMEPIRVLSKK